MIAVAPPGFGLVAHTMERATPAQMGSEVATPEVAPTMNMSQVSACLEKVLDGVQEEMMVTLLEHLQGCAAACSLVAAQRLRQLNSEMLCALAQDAHHDPCLSSSGAVQSKAAPSQANQRPTQIFNLYQDDEDAEDDSTSPSINDLHGWNGLFDSGQRMKDPATRGHPSDPSPKARHSVGCEEFDFENSFEVLNRRQSLKEGLKAQRSDSQTPRQTPRGDGASSSAPQTPRASTWQRDSRRSNVTPRARTASLASHGALESQLEQNMSSRRSTHTRDFLQQSAEAESPAANKPRLSYLDRMSLGDPARCDAPTPRGSNGWIPQLAAPHEEHPLSDGRSDYTDSDSEDGERYYGDSSAPGPRQLNCYELLESEQANAQQVPISGESLRSRLQLSLPLASLAARQASDTPLQSARDTARSCGTPLQSGRINMEPSSDAKKSYAAFSKHRASKLLAVAQTPRELHGLLSARKSVSDAEFDVMLSTRKADPLLSARRATIASMPITPSKPQDTCSCEQSDGAATMTPCSTATQLSPKTDQEGTP